MHTTTPTPASNVSHLCRFGLAACLSLSLTGVAAQDIRLTDEIGREVHLHAPAQRIVSLAPHVTELLFAAGAGAAVVGVVSYSDHPPEARQLPQVGSYTNVDMEAVAALRPDLVVAWHSGNRAVHLDKLEALGIAVYINEPRTLEAVADSIEALGRLAGTEAQAMQAASAFRNRHNELAARYRARPPVRMFYQIWNQPLMTVNDQHLISDVIRLCGGINVFGTLPALAPKIGEESVLAANPEAIVASGMGEARPEWLDQWRRWPQLTAATQGNLYFVPPDLIQRHTPRILDGASQLCAALEETRRKRAGHPD